MAILYKIEMEQLHEYNTFEDLGKYLPIPAGVKIIRTHIVFVVKNYGRHKERMIPNNKLTHELMTAYIMVW